MISTITYNGDGSNRVFPVAFKIEGEDYVRIFINDVAVLDRTTYDIINNSIVFVEGYAPPVGEDNVNITVATSASEVADPSGFNEYAAKIAVNAYIESIGTLQAEAFQVDGDMPAAVVFDKDLNKLTFSIPEGKKGEKGDKPIVVFTLDIDGNLSYEVTYENDYTDGIGVY